MRAFDVLGVQVEDTVTPSERQAGVSENMALVQENLGWGTADY